MSENFKRLCELTADMIDTTKISNPTLKRVLDRVIDKRGGFVFFGRKGHKDWKDHTDGHGECACGDDGDFGGHGDWSEHKDHQDHNDYTESSHRDNRYSEAHYHTDSSGGHRDYTENSHRDR